LHRGDDRSLIAMARPLLHWAVAYRDFVLAEEPGKCRRGVMPGPHRPGQWVSGDIGVLRQADGGEPALVNFERGDRRDVARRDVVVLAAQRRPAERLRRTGEQRVVIAQPYRADALGPQCARRSGRERDQARWLRVEARRVPAGGERRIAAADQHEAAAVS